MIGVVDFGYFERKELLWANEAIRPAVLRPQAIPRSPDLTWVRWQSRSPGNEQRYMWSSAAAEQPGSRNYSGIKNPAIDELIEIIVQAKTRKELVHVIQAMDRILTHQYYVVPHWYISFDRLVHWNKFSHPATNPSQALIINNIMEWWWVDKAKAQKLKKARAANIAMK